MITSCQICKNHSGNRTHFAREMMFGWREEFPYLECAVCGCLQLAAAPGDMAKYYSSGYYSVSDGGRRRGGLYATVKRLRTRSYLTGEGILGRLLLRKFGPPQLLDWVKHASVTQNSRILEVGCGSGRLLRTMQSEGFRHLTGIDPFIARDIDYGNGLKIIKSDVFGASGTYDFVVLEHAFEHIPRPHETMAMLKSLLAPGGKLIVSIPVIGYAWHHYGVDWVQLDAPRHLFLHTEQSFRRLAGTVQDVVYDSTAMQFWGSEQYRLGIPLLDKRSYRTNRHALTPQQVNEFAAMAEELNRTAQGDQATFYVSP